ncbi:MAG: SusD/RagB family nutrient-binding outer membrane lipoprotein, partial [Tunicatimonas sp.]|uniref:SusD/RagB family nutrient-binding outer membrane lipoprotein n=1 Tax=Tunicatimonas sp. TaxID=1940096 RepID=UPI003C718153
AFNLFNTEAWEEGYSLLNDLAIMQEQAIAEEAWGYAGIAGVIQAFTWTNMLDLYGDVPFNEALTTDVRSPIFDDHASLYDDIHAILDESIDYLNRNASEIAPGDDDVVYSGDLALWAKTAYGLKARLYMKLINVEAGNAQRSLDAVGNSFVSQEESFVLSLYTNVQQNGNPLSVPEFIQPRSAAGSGLFTAMLAFTPNNTIEEDPRAELWLTVPDSVGVRTPGPNGQLMEDFLNPNGNFYSKPKFLQQLDAPFPVLTYTELLFITAEAHLRQGNTAAAHEAYLQAVTVALEQASLFNPDLALSEEAIATYLDYPTVDPGTANLALEDIILQKIIYFTQFQFIEAYNETRRTAVLAPVNPEGRANQFTYPDSERTRNPNIPTNVNPLSVLEPSTKLVWAQ